MVDRDDRGHPVAAEVGEVAAEVGAAGLDRGDVLGVEVGAGDAAVVLERPDGGDEHRGGGVETGLAALDVEELLRPEVGAEARLGDDDVAEPQRRPRRDDRVAAVGDVGEGPAVDEGGVVLERLHEVRQDRLGEQHRHRPVGLEVARRHRPPVAGLADDDGAEPALEVGAVGREAEDRHHLGRGDDVEAGLAGEAVPRPPERDGEIAERPVVHVDDAPPRHPPRSRCRGRCPSGCGCRSAPRAGCGRR